MINGSSSTCKVTRFTAFVNEVNLVETLSSFIANLERQMGRASYGCNYTTTSSGLKKVTVIFKEQING